MIALAMRVDRPGDQQPEGTSPDPGLARACIRVRLFLALRQRRLGIKWRLEKPRGATCGHVPVEGEMAGFDPGDVMNRPVTRCAPRSRWQPRAEGP